eukprot:31373-Pelagococcus_subviridis.AAC.6
MLRRRRRRAARARARGGPRVRALLHRRQIAVAAGHGYVQLFLERPGHLIRRRTRHRSARGPQRPLSIRGEEHLVRHRAVPAAARRAGAGRAVHGPSSRRRPVRRRRDPHRGHRRLGLVPGVTDGAGAFEVVVQRRVRRAVLLSPRGLPAPTAFPLGHDVVQLLLRVKDILLDLVRDEVVSIRAVKAQKAVRDAVAVVVVIPARIHPHAKISPEKLRLVLPQVRQHAAEFENQERLRDLLGGPLLPVRPRRRALALWDRVPRQRLELRLAVDPAEVPALLQDGHHLLPLIHLFVPVLSPSSPLFRVVLLRPFRQPRRVQLPADVQKLLQSLRRLQFRLLPRASVRAPREQVEQRLVLHAHLHLLLRRPVAVPDDREHGSELLFLSLVLLPLLVVPWCADIVAVAAEKRGCLLRLARGGRRRPLRRDRLARGVVEILRAVLHERPPVHVADVGPAFRAKQHREPLLFPVRVSLDAPVHDRRLPRLRVRVVGPDGVHLDVRAARGHEVLVDERLVAPHERVRPIVIPGRRRGVILRRLVPNLPEQRFVPAADGVRVVDAYVVVLRVRGLLHERLGHAHAVVFNVVLRLDEMRRLADRVVRRHHPARHRIVPVHDDVRRDRDVVVLQRLIHHASVEEVPLRLEVVHDERLAERRVRLRLRQREPVAEERDERVHDRPLLDRLLQDALVPEDDDLELAVLLQTRQDLAHRLALRFFVHRAYSDAHHRAIDERHRGRRRAFRGLGRRRARVS